MLKFFRKIRQSLIAQNKLSKYLLYALGEIVLVVIGILIALQVNNWNEKRKLEDESQEIVSALHSEFTTNRAVLKDRIQYLEDANRYVVDVLQLVGKPESVLQAINIDSLISISLKYGNYNPVNSTIQEIISTGRLRLIPDEQLKANLFKWLQLLEDTDEDFKNQDLQAITMLEVYLSKWISYKNTVIYHPLNYGEGESILFDGKFEEMFKDLEFENLYYGKRFWNQVMINHYKELDNLAMEIIRQTDQLTSK